MSFFLLRDLDFFDNKKIDYALNIKNNILSGINKEKEIFDLEKYLNIIKDENTIKSMEDDYVKCLLKDQEFNKNSKTLLSFVEVRYYYQDDIKNLRDFYSYEEFYNILDHVFGNFN